ncbi:MAG: prephenate dehydratase [Acidobacteriota bacterium]
MRIGIQGEIGSFSEEAAVRLFGQKIDLSCFRTFDEVFVAAETGRVDGAVVPLENSLTGSIHRNYDLLLRHRLRIRGELYLPIRHNLIALPGVDLADVKVVISHPVALGQCEKFLAEHPEWEVRPTYDTSGSVKELVEGALRDHAAIASHRAAECFGAEVLVAGIEDSEHNFTRFVYLSPGEVGTSGDKTSVVFSLRNVPGALFKCLSAFALREIDLTKIESRPLPGRPWEYLFYVDFLGNPNEDRVGKALAHLREFADWCEVLGCYPRDRRMNERRF